MAQIKKYVKMKYPPKQKIINGVKFMSAQVSDESLETIKKEAEYLKKRGWIVRRVKYAYMPKKYKYALYIISPKGYKANKNR